MTRTAFDSPAFHQALEATTPTLLAIPVTKLEPVRLDVEAAVFTVLGVLPKVSVHRDEALAELGPEAASAFDRLEPAAQACGSAHARHLTYLGGAELEGIARDLMDQKNLLLTEAESLILRDHFPRSRLASLKGGQGYRDLCFDVLQIVNAYRQEWASSEAHTPVTIAELDRAEAAAHRLATEFAEREQAVAGSSPSGELRRRAYTNLVHTYDEVRRAISYLRWYDDDADAIAPSLWAGRKSGSKDDDEPPALPVTPPTNGQPIPPGMPGAPVFATS